MANKAKGNFALEGANNQFSAVWKLTRCAKAAGWKYAGSSNGSTKEATGVATADLWGGNADPMADAFPTGMGALGNYSWLCLVGPAIVKLTFGASGTSGPFQRGERVNQATTGAYGLVLGVVLDTDGSGYAVILPHTASTWNGSNVVTGTVSASTLTPTACQSFYQELVFVRGNDNLSGTILWGLFDESADTAVRFSLIVGDADCTATQFPGYGTGNNQLGARTYAIVGSGGAGSHLHGNWVTDNITAGTSQMGCANATPGVNVYPDGSMWIAFGDPNAGPTNFRGFLIAQFMEDGEPGDICPYVSTVFNNSDRTSGGSAAYFGRTGFGSMIAQNGTVGARTFRRAGLSGQSFCTVTPTQESFFNGNALMDTNTGDREEYSTEIQVTAHAERIGMANMTVNSKVRKGYFRWLKGVRSSLGGDTAGGNNWFGGEGIMIGPYDTALSGSPTNSL